MPFLISLFKFDSCCYSYIFLANDAASRKIVNLLDLSDNNDRWPISPKFNAFAAQAASVCLEKQGHDFAMEMEIEGDCQDTVLLVRERLDQMALNLHADMQRSTEFGAYAIAALILPLLTQYIIVESASKGGGFDFWLGLKNDNGPPFQNKARLEVSGILSGNSSKINNRIKVKLNQISVTDNSSLPGYISITEFSSPRSTLVEKDRVSNG
jgi:hypothetical protein